VPEEPGRPGPTAASGFRPQRPDLGRRVRISADAVRNPDPARPCSPHLSHSSSATSGCISASLAVSRWRSPRAGPPRALAGLHGLRGYTFARFRLRAHARRRLGATAPGLASAGAREDGPVSARPKSPRDVPGRAPAPRRGRLPPLHRARVPPLPRLWIAFSRSAPCPLPVVWTREAGGPLVKGPLVVPIVRGPENDRHGGTASGPTTPPSPLPAVGLGLSVRAALPPGP
jgi:hypothetical protein